MDACELFKALAVESHERIRLAQIEYRLKIFETTITQNILFVLRRWAMQRRRRVEVYAFDATHEPVNGDDLELYIQTSGRRFESFAVQCKLGNTKRKFAGFSGGHGLPQCDDLLAYSAANGLTPLYLFYAHLADIHANDTFYSAVVGADPMPKELYGCSYAPAAMIRHLLAARRIPSVREVVRDYSMPWHLLVCRDEQEFGHGLGDVYTKTINEIEGRHDLRPINLYTAAEPDLNVANARTVFESNSGKRKFRPGFRVVIRNEAE